MKFPNIIFTVLMGCMAIGMSAQSSDNGDGTFTNPVIWGDFPDPDVIRVDDTFYFVSTSMHYFPGVTILESKDLVNWQIACNAVESFDIDPAYSLQGGNRYAKGQWATSIRHFGGKFHVLFNTNTEGTFFYSSPSMEGPWKQTKVEGHRLYDPGMFVDNDGRVYVVHGNTDIFVTEIDLETLQEKGPAKQIYRSHRGGLEGNRCYHIGDYYYIYCTYGGDKAGQTCLRSRSLFGPYEEREVMFEAGNRAESILHQSCIVPLQNGEYWGMIFQDRGGLGRIPWLIPIYWVNGWPIMGDPTDGIMTLKTPVANASQNNETSGHRSLKGTDYFDSDRLALKWQFNHNPDNREYSLTERPGHLRLHTATMTDSLRKARNTVTQRIFGPYSQATAKIDFSHQKNGDRAGLVILAEPFATLAIEKKQKGTSLSMTIDEDVKEQVAIKGSTIWLRAKVDGITDNVSFSFSSDGKEFHTIGENFHMEFINTYFCGNRYGLFNYATRQKGGYIDIDSFEVEQTPLFSRESRKGKVLEAEWSDYQWNTACAWSDNGKETKNQDVEFLHDGGMIAFRNLDVKEPLNKITFTLRNHDAEDVFIELKDVNAGEVLGTADVPAHSTEYSDVVMNLDKPLPSDHRLEIRIWNKGWNLISMGKVSIDKMTLE